MNHKYLPLLHGLRSVKREPAGAIVRSENQTGGISSLIDDGVN